MGSNVGLSENDVPLHPMVLLIIIPIKNCYFIGGIPHFQTYPCVVNNNSVIRTSARSNFSTASHIASPKIEKARKELHLC